jgi:hypothetical protein
MGRLLPALSPYDSLGGAAGSRPPRCVRTLRDFCFTLCELFGEIVSILVDAFEEGFVRCVDPSTRLSYGESSQTAILSSDWFEKTARGFIDKGKDGLPLELCRDLFVVVAPELVF